jgi:hypothetical protein
MKPAFPPIALRDAVATDLRPVRPLPPAWRRTLWLAIPLALALVSAWRDFGLRGDAARLGPILLWAASALQLLAGGALLALALRLAIPGERLGRGAAGLGLGIVVAWLVGLNMLGWQISPSRVPTGHEAFYWRVCSSRELLMAAPLVVGGVLLLRRAFALRPALAGALCGLGAGLMVDSGWRTVCSITAADHIVDAHLLPVLVSTLLGAAAATLLARRR